MIFLISMILASLLIALCAKPLKQHPVPFYIAAVVISAATAVCVLCGVSFPAWVRSWILPIFSRSAFATALWVAVMWTGALPNGSALIKRLMPIRGELSILAAILTLGHNVAYGKTYFRFLFTQPARLPVNQLLAAICSVLMICIMLPLFVTSFKAVRKKMKPAAWKKLQRCAYGFYGLLYVHIMLLTVPNAASGRSGYLLTVLLYSVVFLGYGVCRILKACAVKQRRTESLRRWQSFALAGALVISLCLSGGLWSLSRPSTVEAATVAVQPEAVEQPQTAEPEQPAAETETVTESEPQEAEQPETEPTETEQIDEPEESEESEETADTAEPTEQPDTAASTVEATATEPASSVETPAASTETAQEQATSTQTQTESESEPEPEPDPEPVRVYQNGTFSGTGEGFEGAISVNVTIQDDVITAITVTASSDDEPFWSDGQTVISRILAAQSADVDTVSGATFSSGGILQAVKAALASARN
jgi:DMSO/TMAO reductase YedYZ heme-binding membrane subunit/uncharacterized protein with FMN-binding domain